MFTASYTVMQADVKAGAIFNTATARGDTPGGDPDDPSDDVTDTDDELVVVGAPASLGNFVWHDLNANGIQDLGEPGVAGARVTLIGGGADGVIGTGGDDTHLTTVTDERGGVRISEPDFERRISGRLLVAQRLCEFHDPGCRWGRHGG